jgi:hypothetical protein
MTLGVNGTALVNSTFTFVNKCCQAFSMFFSGMILSATGFNKDVTEQTPGCLKAILLLCTIGPIVGYLCSLIAMYFYPLTRKGEIEMQEKHNKMEGIIGEIRMFAGDFAPQLPHESFRVVHLTKNYKPKQHQETQIIMLILNRKTSQQWLVFVFITKAFVSIEISLIFVMLIPTIRGNITSEIKYC